MALNEQHAPNGIEWTRVILPDGTRTRGFTWNPISGCQHACRWQMPDGKIAECYAETNAENGVAKSQYPQGFAHHYWKPQLLGEPARMKERAGIFVGSMADVFGAWVPDEQITAVLDVCRSTPQHIYFMLTKNAPRLLKFEFPPNVWVGASSPPDFMFGKPLSVEQRERMMRRTLKVLTEVKASVRWMSIEPLSHDYSHIFHDYPNALTWAVIGAASDGKRKFPPSEADLRNTLEVLDAHGVSVFFKGNMRSLPYAAANWREGFPIASAPVAYNLSPTDPAPAQPLVSDPNPAPPYTPGATLRFVDTLSDGRSVPTEYRFVGKHPDHAVGTWEYRDQWQGQWDKWSNVGNLDYCKALDEGRIPDTQTPSVFQPDPDPIAPIPPPTPTQSMTAFLTNAPTPQPPDPDTEVHWKGKYVETPENGVGMVKGLTDHGNAVVEVYDGDLNEGNPVHDILVAPRLLKVSAAHTTIVYTARIDSRDTDALDITVKSASTPEGKFFAPTWEMVNSVKSGAISETEYEHQYEALLRGRYAENANVLKKMLYDRRRIVFTCYCGAPPEFCHRHLAVNVLEKIGAKFGFTVLRGGELEAPKPVREEATVQLALFGDEPPKPKKVYV